MSFQAKILGVLFNPKVVLGVVTALVFTIVVYHFQVVRLQTDLKIAKTSLGVALTANQSLQTEYDTLNEVFSQYKTDTEHDQALRDEIDEGRVAALIETYETQITALEALLRRREAGEVIQPHEIDEAIKPAQDRRIGIEYDALFKTHCLYLKPEGCL